MNFLDLIFLVQFWTVLFIFLSLMYYLTKSHLFEWPYLVFLFVALHIAIALGFFSFLSGAYDSLLIVQMWKLEVALYVLSFIFSIIHLFLILVRKARRPVEAYMPARGENARLEY